MCRMSELRELSSRLDFFLAAPLPVKDVGDLFHCSLHVIKAFYKRDRILKGGFCEFAANYGHLDALKWGHKKGFPIELGTWVNALSQPRILEWLVDTLEVQAVFLHAIVER